MIEVPVVILGGYSRKFSRRQYKIKLCRDNLGEQIVAGKHTFRLSESPKSKRLANMVLPPGYIGFIKNLPFWATWRLERMKIPYQLTSTKTSPDTSVAGIYLRILMPVRRHKKIQSSHSVLKLSLHKILF